MISSNDQNARSSATGVAILLHRRWTDQVKKKICLHDRVMAIDLKLPHRMVRVLAVYLPNAWNYDLNYFQEIFMDIERLSMEGMDKGYALIIAGDFNLSLERGDRGAIMAEFCEQQHQQQVRVARKARPASEREKDRILKPFESQNEIMSNNVKLSQQKSRNIMTKHTYVQIDPSEIGNIKYILVFIIVKIMI